MQFIDNPEGIKAITDLSDQMNEGVDLLKQAVGNLRDVFDSNRGYLGAHEESIGAIISDLEDMMDEGTEPIKVLVLKLLRLAKAYTQILENDRYKGRGR